MNRQSWTIAFIAAVGIACWSIPATADHYHNVDGIEIYLGVMPLAMVTEDADMHGGAPRKEGHYHLTVALYESKTGERLQDARVEAEVAPLGLENSRYKSLEPMQIAGTITFGEYFELDLNTVYRINLHVKIPGRKEVLDARFEYDNRAHGCC